MAHYVSLILSRFSASDIWRHLVTGPPVLHWGDVRRSQHWIRGRQERPDGRGRGGGREHHLQPVHHVPARQCGAPPQFVSHAQHQHVAR